MGRGRRERKGKGRYFCDQTLAGSEEAPTTAKYGAVKKARAAVSVAVASALSFVSLGG
jgi:predicted transcriptional regulator of viral defense system